MRFIHVQDAANETPDHFTHHQTLTCFEANKAQGEGPNGSDGAGEETVTVYQAR